MLNFVFMFFVLWDYRLCIKHMTEGHNKNIACRTCGQILSSKANLFNVPGAEGIAGAYVNSYG